MYLYLDQVSHFSLRGLEFRPQMFGSFLQKEVQLEVLCATIFTVQLSLQYHGQEVSTQSECPFCLYDDNCYHSLEGHQLIKDSGSCRFLPHVLNGSVVGFLAFIWVLCS
jgi:hypothetical protein